MQKLGKNQGRYLGDRIQVGEILEEIHALASAQQWQSELLYQVGDIPVRAYRRECSDIAHNFYFSSGIHGDEPAGPIALRELFARNAWPRDLNLWVCPCLNPAGFHLNTRENEHGVDLNRDYRHLKTAEVRSHVKWLERQPFFDVTVLLHEDWEANGFYVYELNPFRGRSFARVIVEAVSGICPIEHSSLIDNLWKCENGIINPHIPPEDRPQWAEALWLIKNKSPQSYTLETPSDFPLELRVRAHVSAVRRIFETAAR